MPTLGVNLMVWNGQVGAAGTSLPTQNQSNGLR